MSNFFYGVKSMEKIKMQQTKLTFDDGFNMYIENCRQRNLREATINHYKQSYKQFINYFSPDIPLCDLTKSVYDGYVIYLKQHLTNDVSINAYLRDLITIFHYLMNNDYMQFFKMQSIKVDKSAVETYTDAELHILLQKPNVKNCTFIEYESWVISCLLFCTGIRQHSLMELKIKDIDFDTFLLNVRVTKTRKPLLIPLNQSIINILKEFLLHRQYHNKDDWLFCNVYGNQLKKSTCYNMLYRFNKSRGIETTGIHRYRHTFAKQWIINGGNVVTLSRLLGHSNLSITQNYINLLVSDVAKQVNEINLLDKFSNNKHIKMKRK